MLAASMPRPTSRWMSIRESSRVEISMVVEMAAPVATIAGN